MEKSRRGTLQKRKFFERCSNIVNKSNANTVIKYHFLPISEAVIGVWRMSMVGEGVRLGAPCLLVEK